MIEIPSRSVADYIAQFGACPIYVTLLRDWHWRDHARPAHSLIQAAVGVRGVLSILQSDGAGDCVWC
jgi:hypothetical protein